MLIKVAAGIVLRDKQVLISLRKSDQHQGGLWEFPGGKCEPLESASVALLRELKEECDISITDHVFFRKISHDYGDKQVELFFYKVTAFDGDPVGKEGQEVHWVDVFDLLSYKFPEANKIIVTELMKAQ